MSGLLTGTLGELRVGYQRAAILGRWQASVNQSVIGVVRLDVSGRVRVVDEFWKDQEPIDLWLWMGQSWWVWRRVDVYAAILPGQTIDLRAQGNPEARFQ